MQNVPWVTHGTEICKIILHNLLKGANNACACVERVVKRVGQQRAEIYPSAKEVFVVAPPRLYA